MVIQSLEMVTFYGDMMNEQARGLWCESVALNTGHLIYLLEIKRRDFLSSIIVSILS